MQKARFREIDILRGLGIFFIIIIHTASYFTDQELVRIVWNFSQFAVPLFVFCSTYLFYQKRSVYIQTSYVSYVKKRLWRLLGPYYIFLVFYLPAAGILSFDGIKWGELIREVTLTSQGTQINWAVLLFVYVAAIMPLLLFLYRKRRPVFFLYTILAVASSLLFIYKLPTINYKLTMWLPWSLIILYSWFFVRYEDRGWFYPSAVFTSGGVFLMLYMILQTQGKLQLFIDNKYPPNLYFISYGIFATTFFYLLAKRGVFNIILFRKPIDFLSKNSYSIFFIHLFLIVAATKFFDVRALAWWQFFAALFATTIFVQYVLSKLQRS